MKTKHILTSLALVLATSMPAIAGCGSKSHQAMSCAEGMIYDPATGGCVKQVTS